MPPQLKSDFFKLLKKYLNGDATAEEVKAMEHYYAHFSNDPDITDTLNEEELYALKANLRNKIENRIKRAEKRIVPIYRKRSFQFAASVLLLLSLSILVARQTRQQPKVLQMANRDLLPGTNKAVLTLANGSKISLSSLKNGSLTSQPGAHIVKKSGQLAYQPLAEKSGSKEISYNVLTTPKGGQYQLTLVDGTKVWLNAASSLRFPTAFSGADRVVELVGEAYFEVAHNAKQPFKVKIASQLIQDIGTQFNINSYTDEEWAATTLVEGSIKIYDKNGQTLVKPGQQYLLKTNGHAEVKDDVDLDEITAWKSGMFQFDNADIKTIMRQISRWYNVDVEYKGPVAGSTYHGRISRNSNASEVLKILELSGINFTIERGKIIVK